MLLCEMTTVWLNKTYFYLTESQYVVHRCPIYYHEKTSVFLTNSEPLLPRKTRKMRTTKSSRAIFLKWPPQETVATLIINL